MISWALSGCSKHAGTGPTALPSLPGLAVVWGRVRPKGHGKVSRRLVAPALDSWAAHSSLAAHHMPTTRAIDQLLAPE